MNSNNQNRPCHSERSKESLAERYQDGTRGVCREAWHERPGWWTFITGPAGIYHKYVTKNSGKLYSTYYDEM